MLLELPDLEAKLKSASSSIERIDALNHLAGFLYRKDVSRSLVLSCQAEEISRVTTNTKGLAEALRNQVNCQRYEGNFKAALSAAHQATVIYRQLNDNAAVASLLSQIGLIHTDLGDYASGLELELEALRIYDDLGDVVGHTRSLNDIAIVYTRAGDLKQAKVFFERSLERVDEIPEELKARVLINSCAGYVGVGEYETAKRFGKLAFECVRKLDDAFALGVTYVILGTIERDTHQYLSAVKYLELGITLLKETKSQAPSNEMLEAKLDLARCYIKVSELDIALSQVWQVLEICQQSNRKNFEMICHLLMSDIYEQRGDYEKAFKHQKTYGALRDDVLNMKSTQSIENLRIKYEADEVNAGINRQKQLRVDDKARYDRLMQLKEDFFASKAHDLRNPLNNIELSAESAAGLIKDGVPDGAYEYLDDIKRQAGKVIDVVDGMLDIAVLEATDSQEFEMVNFLELFEEVRSDFETMTNAVNVNVHLQVEPQDLTYYCDRESIQQVLENLVSNAIKYQDRGGDVYLTARRDEGSIKILVRDTGIGIPAHAQDSLFEKFFRVDHESSVSGNGLGLSIVRINVERHRGSITVASELGKGSTFTIILPNKLKLVVD